MVEWIAQAGFFALSVLSWRDQFLADQFAGFTPRASTSFAGIEHFTTPSGAPVIARCIAWADCAFRETFRIGDHLCVLGDVRSIGQGEGDDEDPLVYYQGRYHRL
jgi:flavin reductase (DIM6/NTAB) family NADH-FMN oxidoreductase RutF